MKTYLKIIGIMFVLCLAIAAQAQTVIGSWLSAPIPPSPANDEGWSRGQGGFGANGSIFASSNSPAFFELKSGVAAGYAQSLVIHETGYGNVRLYISLSAGQIAAFTNNSKFNFTLSVPPGDAGTPSGYIQQVDFQYNSAGGFHNGAPSTALGWSETGDTGNNSSGQPIFYYSSTSPARQQVVTWDYSSVKSTIVGSGFLQFVFVFQTSGGELTNIYINNVTLSGATVPTIIVDQFNPTNNPYAGTNVYAEGTITNIYANWFGSAFSNVVWDSTMDAQGNPNSGSMKVIASFGTNGLGSQFLLMDKGPNFTYAGINPPITNGLGLLTFQCDVKYDPSSPTWITGGGTNYGQLRFGVVPPYGPQDYFGNVQISVTNTGWVHVTLPLNAGLDPNLLSIQGLIMGMDGGSFGNLQGVTKFWIDNLAFTYTNVVVVPPTVMNIAKATPAMRLFAGSAGTYDRQEVATADQSQSWIGGSYPVRYSFTVKNVPTTINQTHIFLIPANSTPGASPYGYNGVDYTATNGLWLTVGPTGVAIVSWKTNTPGANAYDPTQGGKVALTITNSTSVGTWTLTFNNHNSGSLTAPGASPAPFTINDPNIDTDFANPLVAYFGLQGNNSPGTYEDWTAISVQGVSGVNENEDFTKYPDGNLSSAWMNMSGAAADLVIISTNDMPAYWINWNLPATGLNIGSSTNLPASQWINPAYYSDYNDVNSPRGIPSQFGPNMWILLPPDCLPTVDGSIGGQIAPKAFFQLSTDVVNPPG
ncbi:MAG TPA: hypothetical protein VNN22_14380 [Verrucomicrobiae bacterium]|nr:hypothetical protein [Verrucomicrobiae bacterium]